MRFRRNGIIAGTIVLIAVLVGAIPAAAAVTSWATWGPLAGTGGAYTATVQVAPQPPLTATMTSDSRAGQVGVISGTSTWLSEGTPIGAKYGSSRDQPYLNLRPKADNATSPSTTTYSFATPTPTSGWAFALGDIDSDSVRIHAVAPDGHVLSAAEIGLRDRFNYCAPGVAGKPACNGAADDVPSWDAATLTLTGNAAAADTNGSAAWFEPSTPISSLSFIFTRRAGLPVYQTWFVSAANDITGTVSDQVDGPLGGVALTLVDGNGAIVGRTTTAPDGTYSFPGFIATNGYRVSVTAPAGKIAGGPTTKPVDLSGGNAVGVDFAVREIVPSPVTGRVVDRGGAPIAGVAVTIGGETTTTDADGRYLFDSVLDGPQEASIVVPTGYTLFTAPAAFVVPDDNEDLITLADFVVTANPSLSGAVRWNGSGVPGVAVTAVLQGGGTLTTVTGADGGYAFPRLPAGSYTVTMTTPDGYVATSPVSRTEPVAGTDVTAVDFDLARLGAIDGTVRTDGGAPVGGAVIDVTGPGAPQQLTTEADGTYGLGNLPPGAYELTVRAPSGSTVIGAGTRTVVISDAGESVEGQDFTLAAVVVPPSPSPDPSTGAGSGDNGASGRLPATGLGPDTFAWAAGGAAVIILGATLLLVSRRRSRRK
ncbi:collagen binding domain-containing protein [Microbacterium sp. NPDC091662]|uniref:MSCRAMM family protein n=1 Tax=Microbacterium sp. NPDC091662 TaxID=3364211 RepID=UPI0037F3F6FC